MLKHRLNVTSRESKQGKQCLRCLPWRFATGVCVCLRNLVTPSKIVISAVSSFYSSCILKAKLSLPKWSATSQAYYVSSVWYLSEFRQECFKDCTCNVSDNSRKAKVLLRRAISPQCYKLSLYSAFILSNYLQSSSADCSAQGQVLHCKRRNLGRSSAEGRSSTANSGTKAAVLRGIEQDRKLLIAYRTPISLQHLNRP